jgi:hypothetical protein
VSWEPPADREAIRAELHRQRSVSEAARALVADALVVDMIEPYVSDITSSARGAPASATSR